MTTQAITATTASTPTTTHYDEDRGLRQRRLVSVADELKRWARNCETKNRIWATHADAAKRTAPTIIAPGGTPVHEEFATLAVQYRDIGTLCDDIAARIEEVNLTISQYGLKV